MAELNLNGTKRRLSKLEADAVAAGCTCTRWPLVEVTSPNDPTGELSPESTVPPVCPSCGRGTGTVRVEVRYVDDPEGEL